MIIAEATVGRSVGGRANKAAVVEKGEVSSRDSSTPCRQPPSQRLKSENPDIGILLLHGKVTIKYKNLLPFRERPWVVRRAEV